MKRGNISTDLDKTDKCHKRRAVVDHSAMTGSRALSAEGEGIQIGGRRET